MPAAERTITINQPPSAVFAVIADGAKATLWRPGVLDVALASGSGVGAIYRQGVRGPGGRRIDADYEVTALEPDRRLDSGPSPAPSGRRARSSSRPSARGPP